MENENIPRFGPDHPRYPESQALGLSVAAMRKAKGLRNPDEFEPGTPEFAAAEEAFLRDVLRALGDDPDDPE
ncbi:hypothetical protein P3T23_009294 [Paraburkholderia sp. GAS448]|uniref:hypothetical protein n=1 Tax=Paraburkholderia sp. GAS448 TaxID=3035136 RepID=UPI003D1B238F